MEKIKNIKLNGHTIRRLVIAAYCVFIGASVLFVLFGMYTPNQNSLAALSSVSMDVICMIILLIMICSFAFGKYKSNMTTKLYAGLLIATIWAMFLDFLNWAFDGSLALSNMTYWFTVGSLCMGAVVACVFSLYLYSYMKETHGLDRLWFSARICAILNVLSFIMTFILAITGTAFTFVDGHYEIGALYDVVTVIPVLTVLHLAGYSIRNVKQIGIHDVFAVTGYIGFMVAGALIEAGYGIGTTYVSVAIADIFIFVMLQNEIIAQEKRNVQKWMRKSNTDELTGFLNRHAYEADLQALEKGTIDDKLVYVSIDVNSLKAVNDAFGHYAGDELLVGAAECIKKSFGAYGKLYRIGGDEFIGLLKIDQENLQKAQKSIEETTNSWKGNLVEGLTLSCGCVSRSESEDMSLTEMAILADHRMYEAKDEYYRRTGIDRRKK